MLLVGYTKGSWQPCPDRKKLMEMGGIIVLVGTDRITDIWNSGKPGADFMAVRVVDKDGARHLMGRTRHHAGPGPFHPGDTKDSFHCVIHPSVPAVAEQLPLHLAEKNGFTEVLHREFDVMGDDFDPAMLLPPGWEAGIIATEPPK